MAAPSVAEPKMIRLKPSARKFNSPFVICKVPAPPSTPIVASLLKSVKVIVPVPETVLKRSMESAANRMLPPPVAVRVFSTLMSVVVVMFTLPAETVLLKVVVPVPVVWVSAPETTTVLLKFTLLALATVREPGARMLPTCPVKVTLPVPELTERELFEPPAASSSTVLVNSMLALPSAVLMLAAPPRVTAPVIVTSPALSSFEVVIAPVSVITLAVTET